MKERPILFSGPMVRAILEGRKTQTRRVVKPQPTEIDGQIRSWQAAMVASIFGREPTPEDAEIFKPQCPYGVPGDRLWVKHQHWHKPASDLVPERVWDEWSGVLRSRDYAGVYEDRRASQFDIDEVGGFKRRPSIHMPRWASRITLEVVSVRVERLQDISEGDAKAEGAEPYRCPQADALMNAVGGGMKPIPYTSGFANLWNEINGKTYPWSSNPCVWVVEFKVVPA